MNFIVQYAKSDLTHCSKCNVKIDLREIRIAFKTNDVSISNNIFK
jgi:hypothetical protein